MTNNNISKLNEEDILKAAEIFVRFWIPGNPVNLSYCSYACPMNISSPVTILVPTS